LRADVIQAAPPSGSKQRVDTGRLKRVLYALDLNPGGKFPSLAEQCLQLAREFRERGSLFLPVYFPPLSPEFIDRHAAAGVAVLELDLRNFRWSTLRQLLQLIRENQIEVVNWNFYHPLANRYLWALTVLAPRVEHFYTDHISRSASAPTTGRTAKLKSLLKQLLCRRYQKTVCISKHVRSQLEEQNWPNLCTAYNFVNIDRFCPDSDARRVMRKELGTAAEFVAITVAYLIKDKGIDVAVKALTYLPNDVVLWIVGDGPERERLEALSHELGLDARIRFLGPKQNVAPFLQAADCALVPSVWADNAPMANIEALACGLPVVASRVGGIPEFTEHGRSGYLFIAGDAKELAASVRVLRDDPQLRQRMGEEARSAMLERYSTQSLLTQHLDLYRISP
jgi:glycosyltransferase involved in cell wall biosynthesis